MTADPAWVGDAWEQWHDLAHATHYTLDERVLAGELDSPFHDVCSMVAHLLTIHVLVETHGTDFLRQWVALMAERHPPGRGQPVEGEFWDLAADLLGTPPVPHPDPACVTTRLKDDGA